MDYYQESGSRVQLAVPYEAGTRSHIFPHSNPHPVKVRNKETTGQPPTIALTIEIADETVGGASKDAEFSSPEVSRLIQQAWDEVSRTQNPEVARAAGSLLSTIQEVIASFRKSGFEIGYLPSLRAFNVDDGSVLIEWIAKDFRIGFSIEPEPEASSWYFVSNTNLKDIGLSGLISEIAIRDLVLWLLSFALANS